MTKKKKTFTTASLPETGKVYSLAEAAKFIGVTERTLFRNLAEKDTKGNFKDPFLQEVNPRQVLGRQWRFVGDNMLKAFGSVTYNGQR